MEGGTGREERFVEKKDVNLDDVLEKEEDRPWGTEVVAVERAWEVLLADLDAFLRTIPQMTP